MKGKQVGGSFDSAAVPLVVSDVSDEELCSCAAVARLPLFMPK